jgi:MFS transporter, SP family, galactose:H+ symporter
MTTASAKTIPAIASHAVSPLRKKLIIYFIGFTAALAGLLFGLDIGVISGALPFIKNAFKLSIEAEGTVVSALLWGAVIGTLISGTLSSNYGRRKTILISAVIFVIGSILCSIAQSESLLIGARLFLGIYRKFRHKRCAAHLFRCINS